MNEWYIHLKQSWKSCRSGKCISFLLSAFNSHLSRSVVHLVVSGYDASRSTSPPWATASCTQSWMPCQEAACAESCVTSGKGNGNTVIFFSFNFGIKNIYFCKPFVMHSLVFQRKKKKKKRNIFREGCTIFTLSK